MNNILNEVITLCIDSIYSLYYIYFSQHNYIIKAWVKAMLLLYRIFDWNTYTKVNIHEQYVC